MPTEAPPFCEVIFIASTMDADGALRRVAAMTPDGFIGLPSDHNPRWTTDISELVNVDTKR